VGIALWGVVESAGNVPRYLRTQML